MDNMHHLDNLDIGSNLDNTPEGRLSLNMFYSLNETSNSGDNPDLQLPDSVRYVSKEGIPDFFVRRDSLFIIGDKRTLNRNLDLMKESGKASWLNCDIKIITEDSSKKLSNYIGGDIVIPLYGNDNRIRGYVVGYIRPEFFEESLYNVAIAAYKNQRQYLEDTLIAAAFNNPIEFNNAVSSIFGENLGNDWQNDNSPFSSALSFLHLPILPIGIAALGLDSLIDFDGDFDVSQGLDDISLDGESTLDSASVSPDINSFTGMSSKKKKLLLSTIPEKVSERYIKKHPEKIKEIEAIIGSVSHQDLQRLTMELIIGQKGAMQIFDFTNLSAASDYEIHIKKWDETIKCFDRKFHFCMFLKGRDGKELPIKFQHHPAYSLYMMYVIDRALRGDNAAYLSIRNNREEFIRLEQFIFGEPYEEAEKKYKTFAYRLNKEGHPTRKGRYDDYLRDIDETFVSLVGKIDSIPLKLRDGGHIELLPSRIILAEELRNFKFR